MTSDTMPTTRIYGVRLPASPLIRGVLAPRDPERVDLGTLRAGAVLTAEDYDLPSIDDVMAWTDPKVMEPFGILDVIQASHTRCYVLLGCGWWRVDTELPQVPERSEIVGELTPVPNPFVHLTFASHELRVDDLMYVSGLPGGMTEGRVLDVIFMSGDGRGPLVLVRFESGWFMWRQRFVQVANH
jgi:hypothetical protein